MQCHEIAFIDGLSNSRQTYGCPRVTAALRQGGVRGGKNRVARLMREHALRPRQKCRRWRPVTTDSSHRQPVAENWLAKVPTPDRPDQVWVADITYIDTSEGWLYLAALVDVFTRCCVGWPTGGTLAAELVTQAWQKAVRARRPGPGLLHQRVSDGRGDGVRCFGEEVNQRTKRLT